MRSVRGPVHNQHERALLYALAPAGNAGPAFAGSFLSPPGGNAQIARAQFRTVIDAPAAYRIVYDDLGRAGFRMPL